MADPGLQLSPTPALGGGDCFFDSVRTILESEGIETSVRELRKLVASSLLNVDSTAANEALLQWAQLYADAVREGNRDLALEYQHMDVLFRDPDTTLIHFPLTKKQRIQVARELLKPTFFGEQYSISVLERTTGINLIVLAPDGTVVQQPPKKWRQDVAFLMLNGLHYEPMQSGGQYLFEWRQLPAEVRRLLRELKQIVK